MSAPPPLWRQAFDAAERTVTPRMEHLVRTPGFALGTALVRRARSLARSSAQDVAARAWHLLNLPAGTDVSRLRTQIGALDREVRRLSLRLEAERRRGAGSPARPAPDPTLPENSDADAVQSHRAPAHRAQPGGDPRPGPPRRRAQRPAGT